MKWFRLYDDLLDDPKAQQLSPVLFKHWINLLCLASKSEPRGELPALTDIAFRLRVTTQKARSILKELASAGLLDADGETFHMHNWNDRQPNSDNVAARVKKHREAVSGNDDVTLQKRESNALDTDTDTDTEPPIPPEGDGRTKTPLDDRFDQFWQAYPRKVAKDDARKRWKALKPSETLLAEMLAALAWQRCQHDWTKDNGQFIPYPAVWLNKGRWKDEKPSSAQVSPDISPVTAAIAERDRLLRREWNGQREALLYGPKLDGQENLDRRLAKLNEIINGDGFAA